MLAKNKKEPWGQTVSRFLTPEGLLVGITFTPSMRGQNSTRSAGKRKGTGTGRSRSVPATCTCSAT